ncbi:retropepsin-like aspartic protease [Halobacteriovorax sp. GB3]|uniref:retropepsin-like aspartic protease n=1 Tax=Halobacteriovorax sp. GB3 TaxID=2719615 RepID=UPI00235ED73B|nr:retropepsin-like aspartic protease [Halobacteriovorax sp. GB3]MDD0851491.1 retropepsin-like aspartic protease [Halobacteriovorax sp. GB3]
MTKRNQWLRGFFTTVFLFIFTSITPFASEQVQLPIVKSIGGLIITKIELAGKDHLFLLDTGSNANFINPALKSELLKSGHITTDTKLDTVVNTFSKKIALKGHRLNLKLKNLTYNKMPTYFMDNNRFTKAKDGIDCCSGILGIDFLKKYPIEFDLKNKVVKIKTKFNAPKQWERLSFDVIGKNVLKISCMIGKRNVDFRFDSGSEAPLIFHTNFSNTHRIAQKAYLAGHELGPLFVNLGEIRCGNIKFTADSYAYLGSSGALSHSFIDGNMGPSLLGEHYVFDFNKKAFFIAKPVLENKVPYKSYEIDLKAMQRNSIGELKQAEALILNSCIQVSGEKDCINKWCRIYGKKCSYNEKEKGIGQILKAMYPKTSLDCSHFKMGANLMKAPLKEDYCWWKETMRLKEKEGEQLEYSVVTQKKDYFMKGEFQLYLPRNQVELTKKLYCYAIYSNLITTESVEPLLFALSIKGMSLSNKRLKQYYSWLAQGEGQKCQAWMNELFPYEKDQEKLESLFFGRDHLVIVNPLTILGDGVTGFEKGLTTTLSHEALHVLYDKNKKIKKYVKDKWSKLSDKKKEEFKKAHPSYQFDKEDVLLKEYFSYTFQDKVDLIKKEFMD